jgi:hypothetical protein
MLEILDKDECNDTYRCIVSLRTLMTSLGENFNLLFVKNLFYGKNN